ncbi:MAG: glutathione S-transferase N-terminal domain-containing protein [Alphaproteobacteria bacterium]
MKLRYSPASPFVRKVWLAVCELGLEDRVERIPTNPLKRDDVTGSPNPLGKVPALETDDGEVLYDSPVIIDYLDHVAGGGGLIPAPGPARWTALRRQALADGMMDASILCFIEAMRKPERQSAGWIAHNRAAVERALSALEAEAGELGEAADVGTLTIAVMLELISGQLGDLDWRASCPALGRWFDAFRQRPSMTATELVDPRSVP